MACHWGRRQPHGQPSPLTPPAGRGNWHPAAFLGRTSLRLPPFVPRFNAETPARPSGFDSPLSGARFSLSPGERAGVRAVLKLGSGISANAVADEVTRRDAFDGQIPPR